VVDFLNRLKDEKNSKDDPADVGPLEKMLDSATAVPVTEIETRNVFSLPNVRPTASGSKVQRIQYDIALDQAQAVKRFLNVTSWKDVGVKTFEYFYTNEVEE
jgi:hypothetical protein